MRKTFISLTFIYCCIMMGCKIDSNQTINDEFHSNLTPTAKNISPDSISALEKFKLSSSLSLPAYIVNQIDVSHNFISKINSHQIIAQNPQVRTPGTGSFSAPQNVEATPQIWKTPLPELFTLKDPVSRDANPFSFMSHSKPQGLSHDDIYNFYEDLDGNMWIGTYGGGIMRLDGQYIAHYNKQHGGEIPEVIEIQGDVDGNIWVATTEGLFKINGKHTHFYDSKGGLLHNSLQSLQVDLHGNVWISYWEGGISKFDGEIFHHYGKDQGLSIEEMQILQVDKKGHVWISAYEDGLFLFKEGSFFIYEVPYLSYDHPIMAIGIGRNDDIWLSLYDIGVARFDGNVFEFFLVKDGFPSGSIYQIIEDSKQRVWFGSWGKGAIVMDNTNIRIFGKDQGLSSELINDIYEDQKGIIWIGYSGGMARYYGDIFEHFVTTPAFDQQISAIAQSSDGLLWISSDEGGIMSYDGKKFVHYSSDPENPQIYISGLVSDSKGNIWLSIDEKGIFRFDGKNFYNYTSSQLPTNFYIDGGIEDSKGNLWFIIGEDGILKYDGDSITHFTTDNGLPVNYATTIIEDRQGNIWIGTYGGGVLKIDQHEYTSFTQKDGLGSDYIFSAFADSIGNIWFGTDGKGLSVFNESDFTNFTSNDGLTDNYIFSITQDKNSNMIFGGRFGLNILTKKDLQIISENKSHPHSDYTNKDIHFINHTYEEGFLGVGCNQGAILSDDDRIWIGSNDRLTAFFPEASFYDTIAPKVSINQIALFNEYPDWKQLLDRQDTTILMANGVKLQRFRFSGLRPWNQIPENLTLAHDNNFITFQFTGVSTSSAGKLFYSFMLEGFDRQWNKPTRDNFAHYGNLPPGEYNLRVKAVNRMGLWSEEDQYSFIIKNPWWNMWWAWLMYIFTGTLILYQIVKAREKELQIENKLLDNEILLAHKTIEIKQNIVANVSHELRTPLTGIIGITDILAKTPLNDKQREYLLTLKQTGNNLREIINQILDYAKIESGQLSLKKSTFSLYEMFSHAEKVFESLCHHKDVKFETYIHPEIPDFLWSDRGRINQILLNLLYNAIKFTHKGCICIEAVIEKNPVNSLPTTPHEMMIKISVKDTGVGISEEAMKKLFVPFSQVELKDTRETDSTGLGLAISKKLTELLEGNIGVESTVGTGSTFWFTFKTEKAITPDSDVAAKERQENEPVGSLKILLVEDKKVNQMVIKLILQNMGHKVEIAAHGKIALEMFTPEKYDVILMDIQMPVMDGITATQSLKAKYKDIPPIIGLSANAFEGDREKYIGLGMDEYITKPVTEESLNMVLKKMCFPVH
jgi:two-component system, sensor histidine kinase ChiS